MNYIDRELLLIGVDGCISSLHVQAKGDPIQEGAIKLVEVTRDYIASLSAADVVEVRHGRWLTTDAYPHHLYCSVCYKTYAKNAKWVNELDLPTNYCPNCGALMDGKEDEDGQDPIN